MGGSVVNGAADTLAPSGPACFPQLFRVLPVRKRTLIPGPGVACLALYQQLMHGILKVGTAPLRSSPTFNLALLCLPLNHVPKCHIHVFGTFRGQ